MQQNQGFRGASLSALLGLSLAGAALTPFQAAAQNQARDWSACECVASRGDRAEVRFAQGRVSATQSNGLLPVQSNATMHVPGKVVAGPQSSAIVALGDRCEVRVDANQTVEIRGDGAQLCLARMDSDPEALAGAGTSTAVAVLLGIGGAAGIAGVVAATNDRDKGVSR